MSKELAYKVKQVTAFNLARTVCFEGFGGLMCVLVINIVFSQITCLLFLASLKD